MDDGGGCGYWLRNDVEAVAAGDASNEPTRKLLYCFSGLMLSGAGGLAKGCLTGMWLGIGDGGAYILEGGGDLTSCRGLHISMAG